MENGWHERSILDLIANNVVKRRTNLPVLKAISIRKWKPFYEKRTMKKKKGRSSRNLPGGGGARSGL